MTVPTTRDFAREMRKVIDAAAGEGDFVPRQLATEIVEKLRANDRELLEGWLEQQAETFVWQAINDQNRSSRSHVRQTYKRGIFGKAAEAHAAGDKAAVADFLGMTFTLADGMRRPLARFTADDLTFVADEYEGRERENGLMKVFMRVLAKKVGKSTVEKHFSNEQLTAMFTSLSR